MRVLLVLAAILAPIAGWAQSFEPMSGDDIRAILSDRIVRYSPAWQRFYPSGRTLYVTSKDSWGSWEVRGDQYCSQWPPTAGWACYDMTYDAEAGLVQFIGESGDVTQGTLAAID